jgi:prolyl 4-hydroxylase
LNFNFFNPCGQGDAVLFWNYKPDGTPDENSLHASKPVIKVRIFSLTSLSHIQNNQNPFPLTNTNNCIV